MTDEGRGLTPEYLRCEYRVDPVGIDALRPRLSWILGSGERNQRQTACRVLVADSREALGRDQGTLWDTGVLETDETAHSYEGRTLESRQRCSWKVRVWDRRGQASDWSTTAFWTMGLLDRVAWRARWIGYNAPYARVRGSGHLVLSRRLSTFPASNLPPSFKRLVLAGWSLARRIAPDLTRRVGRRLVTRLVRPIVWRRLARFRPVLPPCPYLRKEFVCSRPSRATLYASALGVYELHLNGARVGDDHLAPGWTDYHRRAYYQTYDVTPLIEDGGNAIGAILADGWYSGYLGPSGRRGYYGVHPWLIAQLELEYPDGSMAAVVTDSTWKTTTGPHLEADLLMGETYDARRELPGWTRPGYDDSAWPSVLVAEDVQTTLCAMPHPPIRKMAEITPVRTWQVRPGCYVFDMGRNVAGWARVKVSGPSGTRVVLRLAERLNPDGTIYTANLRSARATDTYVLKGGGEEVWEPRFTYHGFQYVELTGSPDTPTCDTVTGIVVHTAAPSAGSFECSNPLVNALYENIVWTQRANLMDIPTDCPQRDERLGWLGDAQVFMRTATYNMDMASLLGKWLVDVADAQSDTGAYPDVAPRGPARQDGAPGWADAGIIGPWTLYWVYGDRRFIERHYAAMKRWIAYVCEGNPDLLWRRRTGLDHGDWNALDDSTPSVVFATACFAHSTALLARMAAATDQVGDAARYTRLAEEIRSAFNRMFVGAEGRVKGNTQTCYALALQLELLPTAVRSRAAQRLVEAIQERDGHLSTGFFGTACLPLALTSHGHVDVAYGMLLKETYPSWGYWIRQGATSLWERWDGWTETQKFQDPMMNSFCHPAFGSIGEWLFRVVAGIDTDEPGFKRVVVCPRPGGGLTHAGARYDSVRGRIETSWRIQHDAFELDVRIPANTTATVFMPARTANSITEGGRPVLAAADIEVAGIEGDRIVLKIGSGRYRFQAERTG